MPTTPSPFQRLQWIVIPKVGATLPIIALWLFFVLSPANAGLSEGVEAYNSAHYSQAFNELLPLAKQGNSQAQRLIGEMYRFGLGTSLDLQQGVEWTKKSAGQGDADAQTDLGLLLSGLTKDSNLQPLDKKQGVKWMTQAANGGNAKAQYMLGLIYLGELKDMSGFPKNKKRGLNFLSQSANSSDLEYRKKSAQLLRLIYSGKTEHGNYDFEKELHWFEVEFGLSRTRKAAETGGAKAAMKLAYALSQHSWRPHTVKLKKEIMKWYAQAAAGGVLTGKAAEDYGCMYIYGNAGVPKDFEKAKHWVEIGTDASTLRKAAEAGSATAMAALGDIYTTTCLDDTEETHDKANAEAKQWYEKAVVNGATGKAWELYERASTEDEEKHWAEIAANITTLDGNPIETRYGGETLFEDLPRRDIPWNFRHAPGQSYLTLHPASVHSTPEASSPVNAEIGRFHHLYARPSGAQGWVALIAASKAPYPDPFQYLSSSEVKDGKFVPRRSLNRQLFDPYVGYVREDLLGSLDEVPPPPQIPMRGLMPVPAYWAPIGIDENRRFVTDLSQPPYDALVRIAHQLGSCSGVIVLEPTLVVTSGHCFKTDNDEALVIVERAPNQIDKIPARIVQREEGQHSFKDWAVLRLKRSPNFPVTPLQFADGIDWSNTTRFWGVVTGYPGDLFQTVSKKHVGFEAPSISQCLIDVAQHKAIEDAMQIEHSCEQWFGISGGPLLVWNPNADRFEVLALNTLLSAGFSGTDSELNDLFNESIFRSQAKSVIRQFNLQNESSLFDLNRQDFAGIPGLASVHSAYQRWTTSLYSSKGTLSTKMIEVARREAGLIPEASPYLNDPKRLGFWFSKEKEWNIWLPTTTARADCVQWCDEIIIKPQGWTLQLGQKVNWDELAKRDDTLANENVGWMIVGGDLFYIDKESWEVTGVVRRFMSLKEYGAGFNRQFELWQQYKHLLNEYSDDFIWNEESYSEVKPTSALRSDNFGDDTPTEIPGGKIIKANALARLLDSTHPPLVISSISTTLGLPGSVDLAYSSQGGTYNDDLQQQLGQDLGKLSEGDKSRELVFYCHHAKCWLSYNSALRAINLGYSNVYWFRGGINTWADRGLPFDWMKKVNN